MRGRERGEGVAFLERYVDGIGGYNDAAETVSSSIGAAVTDDRMQFRRLNQDTATNFVNGHTTFLSHLSE